MKFYLDKKINFHLVLTDESKKIGVEKRRRAANKARALTVSFFAQIRAQGLKFILRGNSKWLTEVSLLKEKVRKGQKPTNPKNGNILINPMLTREKKEERDGLDNNNDRVKYRQALVDIITKEDYNDQNMPMNQQINTIR